jgi:hypothetical protein
VPPGQRAVVNSNPALTDCFPTAGPPHTDVCPMLGLSHTSELSELDTSPLFEHYRYIYSELRAMVL